MRLREFERRVRACFEAIPAEFRQRIHEVVVSPDTRPDPDLPDNYLLGECIHLPDWSGDPELASTVVLYHGSFLALARIDPDFDLDAEIRETVLHEVQHHVEDAAGHPHLHDLDWASEQNELRRAGRDHHDGYWRAGVELEGEDHPTWAVDHDLFQEVELDAAAWRTARRGGLRLEAQGRRVVIEPGELRSSPACVAFEGYGRSLHGGMPGDLFVIVRRKDGWLARLGLWRTPL